MMKNLTKFLFFSVIALLVFSTKTVHANMINSIYMDVVIDGTGNAKITETWDVYVDEGTEVYKPYDNLDDIKINSFIVKDETGRIYQNIGAWSTDGTIQSKAFKNGIIDYGNGKYELCFGMGSYGSHTYTMEYEMTNFVRGLSDSQMIYFGFIPRDMSVNPNDVMITISSPVRKFNDVDDKIWLFGQRSGTIYFVDGKIEIKSNYALDSGEYMVGLVKIRQGTFAVTNNSDKIFDDYYQLAMQGVKEDKATGFWPTFGSIIAFIFQFGFWILIAVGSGMFAYLKNNKKGCLSKTKLPSIKTVNYFREIPADKDLMKAYWLAETYNMYKDKSGLMGAILLKWLSQKLITIAKTKGGIFSFKDNNYAIDLTKITTLDTVVETNLYNMYMKASGDGILETREFVKWAKSHYQEVLDWFDEASTAGYDLYKGENLIQETSVTKKILFFDKVTTNYTIDPKLEAEGIRLYGLKRFLLEFGSVPDKPAMEVHLWEEYLIFAAILGVADKVAEQFSQLYPEFKTLSTLDPDMTTPALIMFAHSGYDGARSGQSAASSSGGGGGGFSGGGGGSFGGSSGGGFR